MALPGRPHCGPCAGIVKERQAQARKAAKAASPWAHLYALPRWRKLSRQVLYPQGPKRPRAICVDCADLGADWVPAEVADHIRPHRGDQALFFDRQNLQPLCTICHNRKSQRERMTGGEG